MGASKTNQYSINEIKSANIARALAHPARIRILATYNYFFWLVKKNKNLNIPTHVYIKHESLHF